MRLWIDDIRTPPDESWNICRTVLSAIRAIDMFGEGIDEIALDHDISHQVIVGKMSRPYPCEETFEAVARHIAERIRRTGWKPKISIHTSNPAGAAAMKSILKEVGIEPDVNILKGANRLETIL